MSQLECQAIFKRLDLDRDNRISFWEFNKVFTLNPTSSPSKSNYNPSLSGSITKTDLLKSSNLNTSINTRESPVKNLKSTYLSPLRESTNLNQSLSKSVNRSIELNRSYNNDTATNFSQSYTKSRFQTYEEELFIEYLRETLINEREIERLKCLLSMRTDLNLKDLFKVFQFNNFSYLNNSDIKLGFNSFNVYPTNEEVDLIIKRYDGTNVLANFGFNDMMLPVDLEYNSLMKNRYGYDYHLKYGPEIFSHETRFCLENLFKALVNTEVSAENWREKFFVMKTFDSRVVFDKIDQIGKNYLTSEDVKIFYLF